MSRKVIGGTDPRRFLLMTVATPQRAQAATRLSAGYMPVAWRTMRGLHDGCQV